MSLSKPKIMTFRPTIKEFENFKTYLDYIENIGAHKAGIAKIIPPGEWKALLTYDQEEISESEIYPLVHQKFNVTSKPGFYQLTNTKKNRMKVKDYKEKAESLIHKTPTNCDFDELERRFWKKITYSPPLYGVDVHATLMNPQLKVWNLNNLDTVLNYTTEVNGKKIDGLHTSFLYFGMWKSAFAWHTEDMDLYSVNYLHFGAPKSWYAIPPSHGRKFERLAKSYFPNPCNGFMRHKNIFISPSILKEESIDCNKITQEAGEFIITFPYGYHSGFNHGYNCAEASNFASPRWVEYGKRCDMCYCFPHQIKLDMSIFIERLQPEKYQLWLEGKDKGSHPEDPSRVTTVGVVSNSKSQTKKAVKRKRGGSPSGARKKPKVPEK